MGAGLPRPRSAPAFRVSKGHKKRASPHRPACYAGPLARTSPQRFGEPQLSKLKSESSDMRGGFGSLAQARLPYAGRRTPDGKDRRKPIFSAALYSIIASASLTSSIRRATCAGVSTGWLNSTVWFTVTAGVAGDCAACAVWRPS